MSFVEDGPAIFPLNTSMFSITDEDNSFSIRANLVIENAASLPSDVRDQLLASSTDAFEASRSGDNTSLQVDAVGYRRLITTHDEFEAYLRGVAFTTDDQAPELVRNLSIVVQEFPIGEAALSFAFIPIVIVPVNDQPVLLSSQTAEEQLEDYLPQDQENAGFNASFLLSPSDVSDIDRRAQSSLDFIGLAIVDQWTMPPLRLGPWQYWREGSGWTQFPADLSPCLPLLLEPSTRIRFSPAPNQAKEDGNAHITFHAWDGSSSEDSVCSTPIGRGKKITVQPEVGSRG